MTWKTSTQSRFNPAATQLKAKSSFTEALRGSASQESRGSVLPWTSPTLSPSLQGLCSPADKGKSDKSYLSEEASGDHSQRVSGLHC